MRLTKEQAQVLCDSIDLTSEFFDEGNKKYLSMLDSNPLLLVAYEVLFTIAASDSNMQCDIFNAINRVIEEMKTDEMYYLSWYSNISMACQDSLDHNKFTFEERKSIGNEAAKRFMDNLTRDLK